MRWLVLPLLLSFLPTQVSAAPRLAVLELRDRAELTAAEADYLTDLVRGEAGARGDLLVMTRENIVELLPPGAELAACASACEVETGRRLGADFVVSGEVVRFDGALRVVLRLHATRTAALLGSERAGGDRLADLEAPLERATAALVKRTGVGPAPAEKASALPSPPISPRNSPRIPPALFVQRQPFTADRARWAKLDASVGALLAAETARPAAERTALRVRRGLLAWRFSAAEAARAFTDEDTCLAAAGDAAARTACAADRASRVHAAADAREIAAEMLTIDDAATAPAAAVSAEALFALADARRVLGDHDGARAALQILSTRHPDAPARADGRLLLGVMFFDEGRDAFAEAALRTVIDRHRGAAVAPFARYLLGWTFLRRGKPKAAVAHLRRVLADTADAHPERGADRPWAILRREARVDLVRAWADQPRRRVKAALALFAEIDPAGTLRLPEALAETYAVRGRRADARAVVEAVRAELGPRCAAGHGAACGALERLCLRHGGPACAQ